MHGLKNAAQVDSTDSVDEPHNAHLDRRTFLRGAVSLGGLAVLEACARAAPTPFPTITPGLNATASLAVTPVPVATGTSVTAVPTQPTTTAVVRSAPVALVRTRDRVEGVETALDLLGLPPIKGTDLFLKPNLNSADAAPGSTHNDTLRALVRRLQRAGVGRITVGDRSGMGDTRTVMQRKDTFRMAEELGFETLVFDDLDADGWELLQFDGSHWQRGFALPRQVLGADVVVQTCCLKTHRYGGHFTLSLKNSVGLAAKYVPGEGHNYMTELHGSSYQRAMIAEINRGYAPDLIVLDGVQAFVNGGPASGKLVDAEVILASTDRVAVDAVGVAILRYFGTTPAVSEGSIFGQEQIARAVELGLGIDSASKIELVTNDPASAAYAAEIQPILEA
jgi:uncharacterized protein (DUF362 family)